MVYLAQSHPSSTERLSKEMAPRQNGRKRNKQSPASLVATVSKELANSTSMHGLKYIANAEATIEERILWFLLFCGGLLFALFFSSKLWDNWTNYPIQITIQSANYPINQKYDFPTVTVCSVNKISTRALGDWMTTDEAKDFDLADIRQILKIIATNRISVSKEEMNRFSKLMDKARITSDRYGQLMHSLSPNCSDMIIHCSFEDTGTEDDCNVIFEEEATDGGYCCSFNSIVLHRKQMTNLPKKTLVKSQTSGVYAGLSIILDAELHDYNITSFASVGFKVSIQSPDDFARTEKIGFMVSPGTQVDAAVTGQAVFSDDRLKSIKIEQRECVIGDDEIHLKQFDTYTSPYCVLDCLTEILVEKCNCVPYYYPVPIAIPSCNISMYLCVQQVIANYTINSTLCNCPEQCNYVWYRNEITTGTYPNHVSEYPSSVIYRFDTVETSYHRNGKSFNEYARENFAKLNVYFKSTSGLRYIMDMRTTWADFISATGGLLGLGFGFSLISAAEVMYFLLVRWFIYFYRSRKERNHQSATVDVLPLPAAVNDYVNNEKLTFHSNIQSEDVTHPSRWARIYDRMTYPYYIYEDPWINTFQGVRRFNAQHNTTNSNEKLSNKHSRSNIPIRTVDQ